VASADVISWGQERARARPWRGDGAIAELAPLPGSIVPSAEFVERCVSTLASRGFQEVVTAALSPIEQVPFLAAGFELRERLHLLAHDLNRLPPVSTAAIDIRRARRADRPGVLAIDKLAFGPFWRFDDAGLDEAMRATPVSRFRVALSDGELVGYAIAGRAARRGYLQRLAVDPARQRQGIGRQLTLDALRWMNRRGVDRAVVNTQLENDSALALYQSLGFRLQAVGLSVLARRLA
jgi:ribosomal protein S18 acetylase RimI-like enzyme